MYCTSALILDLHLHLGGKISATFVCLTWGWDVWGLCLVLGYETKMGNQTHSTPILRPR